MSTNESSDLASVGISLESRPVEVSLPLRSEPMGRHREAELLPKVGRSAAAGNSFTADLHGRRAPQPHNSTVSLLSGRLLSGLCSAKLVCPFQASFSLPVKRQRGD